MAMRTGPIMSPGRVDQFSRGSFTGDQASSRPLPVNGHPRCVGTASDGANPDNISALRIWIDGGNRYSGARQASELSRSCLAHKLFQSKVLRCCFEIRGQAEGHQKKEA